MITEILTNPTEAPISPYADQLMQTVKELIGAATKENFNSICVYLLRIFDAGYSEHALLLILRIVRRDLTFSKTDEFIHLSYSRFGSWVQFSSEVQPILDKINGEKI